MAPTWAVPGLLTQEEFQSGSAVSCSSQNGLFQSKSTEISLVPLTANKVEFLFPIGVTRFARYTVIWRYA